MRPRTRINKFGRAVDERGRRIKNALPPADCVICSEPINGASVRSRRGGDAHPWCSEANDE